MNERGRLQDSQPRRNVKRHRDDDDSDGNDEAAQRYAENVDADRLDLPSGQRGGHRRVPSDAPNADAGQ